MSDQPQNPEDVPTTPAGTPDPQSVEGLFLEALNKDPSDRAAYLEDVCRDDPQRRMRIDALLRAYDDAGSFLETPPDSAVSREITLDFLQATDDPSLLGMLGKYEIIERIGEGGMGVVFRARDPKLNRIVAVKVLSPHLAANPNSRKRFLREAQAGAAISHPHVVTIHAVEDGSDDGRQPPYLVMECIVGPTVQMKLDQRGSLRVPEILRIGQQMAEGLAAAHRQGLIHRDIKPANVLLENGVERVKITDFGLARAVDDVSITRTGEVSGTPQYMSPEQAGGEPLDQRSDLFGLGCVMYAMCTGRSPFRATSIVAAIKRVREDEPRGIRDINPDIPEWLEQVVLHLLEKDPEHRPQSAQEVAELLERQVAAVQRAEPPVSVTRPSSTERDQPETNAARTEMTAVAAVPVKPARASNWIVGLLLLTPVALLLTSLYVPALQDTISMMEVAVIAGIVCIPAAIVVFLISRLFPTPVRTRDADVAQPARRVWYRLTPFTMCAALLSMVPVSGLIALVALQLTRQDPQDLGPMLDGIAWGGAAIAAVAIAVVCIALRRDLSWASVWSGLFTLGAIELWLILAGIERILPGSTITWSSQTVIIAWSAVAGVLICAIGLSVFSRSLIGSDPDSAAILEASRQRVGGVLIVGGVLLGIASVVILMVGASPEIAIAASIEFGMPFIVTCGGSFAFLFMATGLILRRRVAGHETWSELTLLALYVILGPIGILLWLANRERRMRTIVAEALAGNTPSDTEPKQAMDAPPTGQPRR